MLAILAIVTPVFGIILAGWCAQTWHYLPEVGARVLTQFAFKVAIPCLLFRAMLGTGDLSEAPWTLAVAYFGGILIVWTAAALLTRYVLRRPAMDGAAIGMGTAFGNCLLLGIPLGLQAFGPAATAPMALLVALDGPLLWIIATLHIETARRAGRPPSLSALGGVVADLATNPIVASVVLGVVARFAGLQVPEVADRFLALMGQAAVPTGLFALGMALATFRIEGQAPTVGVILLLKTAALPAVVYGLGAHVFSLPPVALGVAVLFAAMPVGANAFLFASKYERAVHSVSGAIAVSTALAALTVSLVLYILKAWVL